MLRFKEKIDFESRFRDVDNAVTRWRDEVSRATSSTKTEFNGKLVISLIFHDSALEGDVLTHGEIKAATDTSIISDTSLIPSYEVISKFFNALQHAKQLGSSKKKTTIDLDLIREFVGILNPALKEIGVPYRKENPLHRLYYHEISSPEDIAKKMRVFGQWLEDEFLTLHPIDKAVQFHWQLMAVFPWAKETGRLARIVSNLILEQSDYPIAVIHSIDRQRYYEALKSAETKALLTLYLEAVETTANSAVRVFEAARGVTPGLAAG